MNHRHRRFLCLAVLSLGIPVFAGVLQIHCLNVGHGDATLVISPAGRTLLIDAGNDSMGLRKVLPWLSSRGITSLDWIVATHYHGDHIGGLDEVISGLGRDSVKQAVYDRGWSYNTNAYSDYVRAAGSKRRTIADGMALDLGGGVIVRCLAVNGNGRLRSPFTDPPWSENDLCVALRISYQRFDFSISGDLSGESTAYYRDIETSVGPEIGPVEVLRVNHHGSAYSSNRAFLAALAPLVSVISCGKNDYGLPSQEALSRLRPYGPVYQTADRDGRPINGDVIISSDGQRFVVNGDTFDCKTGVAETVTTPPGYTVVPGIVREVLCLPPVGLSERAGAVLLDVAGRKVTELQPGVNDVGSLTPGVYFLVMRTAAMGSSRKLLLVR